MGWLPIQFELSRPWWLLGLCVLPLLIYYFHRSLVDFALWQRWVSLAVRALILALLVLALSGLNLLRATREQFVVFALDRSQSVGDDVRQAADDFVPRASSRAGRNRYAILPFAAEPGMIRAGEAAAHASGSNERKDAKPLDPQGTDIAAALEVAAAAIPPFYVPKIVLISDGNATAGDASRSSPRLSVSTACTAKRRSRHFASSARRTFAPSSTSVSTCCGSGASRRR